jgi:hypothetical protein
LLIVVERWEIGRQDADGSARPQAAFIAELFGLPPDATRSRSLYRPRASDFAGDFRCVTLMHNATHIVCACSSSQMLGTEGRHQLGNTDGDKRARGTQDDGKTKVAKVDGVSAAVFAKRDG